MGSLFALTRIIQFRLSCIIFNTNVCIIKSKLFQLLIPFLLHPDIHPLTIHYILNFVIPSSYNPLYPKLCHSILLKFIVSQTLSFHSLTIHCILIFHSILLQSIPLWSMPFHSLTSDFIPSNAIPPSSTYRRSILVDIGTI